MLYLTGTDWFKRAAKQTKRSFASMSIHDTNINQATDDAYSAYVDSYANGATIQEQTALFDDYKALIDMFTQHRSHEGNACLDCFYVRLQSDNYFANTLHANAFDVTWNVAALEQWEYKAVNVEHTGVTNCNHPMVGWNEETQTWNY